MNTQANPTRPVVRSSGSAAFTLIELLVVISIIAVLAGLLLPVVSSVTRTARKTSARNTEMQIVAAVNNYYTEYSQYPVPVDPNASTSSAGNDFTYTVDGNNSNGELMNVLRALNSNNTGTTTSSSATATLNSRHISYFEYRNVKTASSPKDGFVIDESGTGNNMVKLKAGDLVDPWGNLYGVRMDAGYSNAVQNPYADDGKDVTDATGTGVTDKNVLRIGVVVFSYGEDGLAGTKGNKGQAPYSPTPGDDVDSWQ